MKIKDIYKLFITNSTVTTDTRSIIKGSMFFALSGANFDGNQFALEALEKGCCYAVVSENFQVKDPRLIKVPNPLNTLQELAAYHRKQFEIPVLGLTGSNGKTTTKELLYAVLAAKYNTIATKGNLNNHIGVPLTLLEIKPDTEFAIVEMGANHLHEIEHLTEIAQPTCGLITNVGKAHLEGFGSEEGVLLGKTELFTHIKNINGLFFLNTNDTRLSSFILDFTESRIITYGTGEGNFVNGKANDSSTFLTASLSGDKWELDLQSQLIGNYNLENILAAISVGTFFEVPPIVAAKAIENYMPSNQRSQFIKTEKNKLVVDCYNANPSSMRSAILNFIGEHNPNPFFILGDMFELGNYTKKEHNDIIELLKNIPDANIWLIGKYFREILTNKQIKSFNNIEEAIEYTKQNPLANKQVLLKGSRGMFLEKLLPYL